MAIGAQTGDVVRLMVRESVVPVAAGIVAGAALASRAAAPVNPVLALRP